MRFTRSAKATALLLLVSFQYSFAMVDVALCSTALCYPKVAGGKSAKAMMRCPEGYKLEGDMCTMRVPKCSQKATTKCSHSLAGDCPAGAVAKKNCLPSFDVSVNKTGRHLLTGGALIKEVNVQGHTIMPKILLPEPAFSINFAAPKKPVTPPSITVNGGHHGLHMPTVILPEPKVSFNLPKAPHVGPKIHFEGHPSIIPNIIPILPEPHITFEVAKPTHNGLGVPRINTDIQHKQLTVDLTQLGPKHTVDLNLPALPDIKHQMMKMPDVEINTHDAMPKVIDLSSLGPKKIYDITLPEVKLPHQGSLTIRNTGAHEPQFLDLTHLGPKHKTGINVKLPKIEHQGATINVVVDADKSVHGDTIVIPGHKEKHNTVINVPGHDGQWPEKNSKLTVDINANPSSKLTTALEMLAQHQKAHSGEVQKVSIKMPDVDLSKHMPAGKDVVIELNKPLLKFDHATKEFPAHGSNIEKRIDIQMKDIVLPQLMKDKTINIKPLEVGTVAKHLLPKHMYDAWQAEQAAGNSTVTTVSKTVINLPQHTLPQIPIPKDAIDAAVTIPLHMGLHAHNSSEADAAIKIAYKEEWTGGKKVLPNPAAKVVNGAAGIYNHLTGAKCITECCSEVMEEVCDGEEVKTQAPTMACEDGFSLDAASGMCSNGDRKVGECPAGMSRCSIDGKGVCVPAVDGKSGHDLCHVFKAVCHKGTILAKSCN